MTSHEIALAVSRLIREALYHDDGATKPCIAGVLNPLWVNARANNAAVAIADLFAQEARELIKLVESRGTAVKGEIRSYPTDEEFNDERIK